LSSGGECPKPAHPHGEPEEATEERLTTEPRSIAEQQPEGNTAAPNLPTSPTEIEEQHDPGPSQGTADNNERDSANHGCERSA
jgi:hypothetical protein